MNGSTKFYSKIWILHMILLYRKDQKWRWKVFETKSWNFFLKELKQKVDIRVECWTSMVLSESYSIWCPLLM